MIAHKQLPGSQHFDWVRGARADCEEWLLLISSGRPYHEWQGMGLLSEDEARKVRYRDGQRVYWCFDADADAGWRLDHDAAAECRKLRGAATGEPDTPGADADGPDVATAKRMLEDAVHELGQGAHDAYVGTCREDRNAAVCAIQSGEGAGAVARQYFGQGAREVVIVGAYEAELNGNRVDIHHRHDGVCEWAGSGAWNGARIVDCTADLPEGVYEALERALRDGE
ncbi:MAG: hypothetical protein H3C30_10340 [Candidatus Hydrogenedentes bacterium]|nr:hypothetical protein [Candidatus Hydrogenedentota bacterium]